MSGITFYSTKKSSIVSIPKNKVCGYRIKNPIMKNGFSDGVRTGRDNGIVNQKLSRFATEQERQEAGLICEGNTNWLNHKKVRFNTPESADNQFCIKRPSFKAGSIDDTQKNADNIPNNIRGGLGNKDITRINFLAPNIRSRFVGDFEALQALDIAEIGGPEKISDNTLGYFTQIKVPDPNDFSWLREKARLEAELTRRFTASGFPADEIPAMVARELEINKPLGREQRTINKNSNSIHNEAKLNVSQKLREIIQEIQDGRVENRAAQVRIIRQLGLIFTDTQAISNLAQTQLQGLGAALARIGVPTTPKALGIVPRFVDITFYNANAGIINLLLFSKVREKPNTAQYNYDKMVLDFSTNPATGLPAIKLTSLVSSMGRANNRQYLDLESGGRIDLGQLRMFANKTPNGFDNDLFDIQPANQ